MRKGVNVKTPGVDCEAAMKLGSGQFLPAVSPSKPVEAVKASLDIRSGLQTYLKDHPQGMLIGGPLGSLGAKSGLSLGAPVAVAPGVEFLPLFFPEANPNLASDLTSSITVIADASSLEEKAWSAVDFVEQLPGLPLGANIAVHALGVLRTAPRAIKAWKKSSAENKSEVGLAMGAFVAALAKLVTDHPALEGGKHAAEGLALAVKHGDDIYLIPHAEAGGVLKAG